MRLVDRNPELMRAGPVTDDPVTLDVAAVLFFDCPKCGPSHRVAVPLAPLHAGGWDRSGDTLETLTLRPSILCPPPRQCGWHGFVTNGEIQTV